MTSILSSFIFRCNVLAVAALLLASLSAQAAERLIIESSCYVTLTVYVQASSDKRPPVPMTLFRNGHDTVTLESPDPFDIIIHHPLGGGVYEECRAKRVNVRSLASKPGLIVVPIEVEHVATWRFERGGWNRYDGTSGVQTMSMVVGSGIAYLRIPMIAGHRAPRPIIRP